MKIQLVVLAVVVCIVLGYCSAAEAAATKSVSKTMSKETAVNTPSVAGKKWTVELSKQTNPSKFRKVASASVARKGAPVKSQAKWFRPAKSQEWQAPVKRPQAAAASGTKGLSKVHWVSKRAPVVKRVPCRTTERPTLRPNLLASPARPAATTWSAAKSTGGPLPATAVEQLPAKQSWAPAAPVASALPASQSAPAKQVAQVATTPVAAPVVATQQVEGLPKAEPLMTVPTGAAKMSFAGEPERYNYDEVMEPEQ